MTLSFNQIKNHSMDPYQLFSTPPDDLVLSSTPLKQKVPKTSTPSKTKGGPKTSTPAKTRGGPKTSTPAKAKGALKASTPERRNQHKAASRSSTSLCTPNAIKKQSNKNRKQKKENVWDKHLKNNPELAQFVDQFNHSLEDATSKPLDMS